MLFNKIYVLYGISGGGKTSLGRILASWGLQEIISHTTRPMREGEIDGVDYYFVDEETFRQIEFIETSSVPTKDNIYHYGLSKREVDRKLNSENGVYAILNREGHEKLKALYSNQVQGVFVTVDKETAYERMITRGDSHEAAISRLEKFKDNFEETIQFPNDILLLNNNFDDSLIKLGKLVKL